MSIRISADKERKILALRSITNDNGKPLLSLRTIAFMYGINHETVRNIVKRLVGDKHVDNT